MKSKNLIWHLFSLIAFLPIAYSMDEDPRDLSIKINSAQTLRDNLKNACQEKNLDKIKSLLNESQENKMVKVFALRDILFDAVLSGELRILCECLSQLISNMPIDSNLDQSKIEEAKRELASQFINAKDSNGQTLITCAINNDFGDIAEYLASLEESLSSSEKNVESASGETVFDRLNLNEYLDLESNVAIDIAENKNMEIESDIETMQCEEDECAIEKDSVKSKTNEIAASKKRKGKKSSVKRLSKKRRIAKDKEKRMYKCVVEGCGKSFKYPAGLRDHKGGIHGDGFKCNVEGCVAIFKYAPQLSNHKKSAHGDGYKCDIAGCDKAFRTSSQLSDHKKIEHGNGFKCNIEGCDRCFQSRSGFIDHKKVAHGDGFKCNVEGCNQYFRSRTYLKNHKNNEH